ncbi:polymeric immunoglobulin receptor-like [Salminus brasiliensis]|uniref:polymeric immunoglobulin receptor-like n=1 Tax=Salminus brasiliensis TaxID=930266 RepID=UPI003B834200
MILLIFTFYLISGPVGCFDVIGYPGGSVTIFCEHQQYGQSENYFCKETPKQCFYVKIKKFWVHKDRVSLLDYPDALTVIYKQLSSADTGSYQCGETGVWSHTVKLSVKRDPCCSGSKTVTGYLGENVTISISYPEEFKGNTKFLEKLNGQSFTAVANTKESPKDRFSISDDKISKTLSVRIRDVSEDDGGVYFCGVGVGRESVSYNTVFTEIQLQVKAPGSSVVGITVGVCVVLVLLIGGLTLIFYRLRCTKTQGSTSPPNMTTMGNVNEVSHSEKIRDTTLNSDPRATSNSSTDPPVQNRCSVQQLPTLTPEGLVYATVSFQENPGSSTNARVNISKEEPDTEYATVNVQ